MYTFLGILLLVFHSHMGFCENVDATKIYGVMPYVASEVLKGMQGMQTK